MPVNRNALIRYKTIDKCLQNRFKKWTLEDLIDACSEVLYEYEGIDKGVSRRTVQADLQIMRSDKLGYNAPIIVIDRKYYTYEDPDYSITNIPISEQDLSQLSEAVEMLKQFSGFNHFQQLNGVVQKLEDHVYSAKTASQPVIDFEKNENLKGIHLLDELYQSIIKKQTLQVTYQSFKARHPQTFAFSAYLLKEYRNRWFLVGKREGHDALLMLALDRILEVSKSEEVFEEDHAFDPQSYFSNVLGVTVNPKEKPIEIIFFSDHKAAPYIITKPIHRSQKVMGRDHFGVTFSVFLQPNFELEKILLGLGEQIKVLSPEKVRRRILGRQLASVDNYNAEISKGVLQRIEKGLTNSGHFLFSKGYPKRFVNRMNKMIGKWLDADQELAASTYAIREVIQKIPELEQYVFSKELVTLLNHINPSLQLVKSIFFDKRKGANWFVTWHQDLTINVSERKDVPGFSGWTFKDGIHSVIPPQQIRNNTLAIRIHLDRTDENNGALMVFPGSQRNMLSNDQINLISENGEPVVCAFEEGGLHVMNPMILHKSSKTTAQGRRRVIHLEFAPADLPGGLTYSELYDFRAGLNKV